MTPNASDRRRAWNSGVVCLPIDCPDDERDNWFAHGGTPAYRMAWLELNALAQAFAAHRVAERDRCAAHCRAALYESPLHGVGPREAVIRAVHSFESVEDKP